MTDTDGDMTSETKLVARLRRILADRDGFVLQPSVRAALDDSLAALEALVAERDEARQEGITEVEELLAYPGVSRSSMSERRRRARNFLAARGRCVCKWAGRRRGACPIHPQPPFAGEEAP